MIIKGTFTSVWDYAETELETYAELDTETGEVIADNVENDEVETLEEEYFTDVATNKVYSVCTTCHSHIVKTEILPVGNILVESTSCTNPDCDDYEL